MTRRSGGDEDGIEPGDGSALPRYEGWHALWRSLFHLDLRPSGGEPVRYAIDVDYFDWRNRAVLFRDERQEGVATMPARFPVEGGAIEVDATMWGLRRVHFVPESGPERILRPARGSSESWRARMGRRFPGTSRVVGALAIVVLVVALGLALLQAAEWLTQLPAVAAITGAFVSPVVLPAWLASSIAVLAVLAAIERALTIRNHWLIDADTWWLGE